MDNYEDLVKLFVNLDKETKDKLVDEWEKYHDEVFFHNAIYEISYMDEVPTVQRISREFGISLTFASILLDYYLENI